MATMEHDATAMATPSTPPPIHQPPPQHPKNTEHLETGDDTRASVGTSVSATKVTGARRVSLSILSKLRFNHQRHVVVPSSTTTRRNSCTPTLAPGGQQEGETLDTFTEVVADDASFGLGLDQVSPAPRNSPPRLLPINLKTLIVTTSAAFRKRRCRDKSCDNTKVENKGKTIEEYMEEKGEIQRIREGCLHEALDKAKVLNNQYTDLYSKHCALSELTQRLKEHHAKHGNQVPFQLGFPRSSSPDVQQPDAEEPPAAPQLLLTDALDATSSEVTGADDDAEEPPAITHLGLTDALDDTNSEVSGVEENRSEAGGLVCIVPVSAHADPQEYETTLDASDADDGDDESELDDVCIVPVSAPADSQKYETTLDASNAEADDESDLDDPADLFKDHVALRARLQQASTSEHGRPVSHAEPRLEQSQSSSSRRRRGSVGGRVARLFNGVCRFVTRRYK
jgi:hypothetical protein